MRELVYRILTALISVPLILAAVWLGGVWFLALLAFLGMMLAWEWSQLFSKQALPLLSSLHLASLTGVCFLLWLSPVFRLQSLIIIALACIGSWIIAWLMDQKKGLAFFGPFYLIAPLIFLADLRADSFYGASALAIFLLMVWASDSGAYFTGRLVGGALLFPKISANKTWSGALGGMTASILAGYGAGFFLGSSLILSLWGGAISIATQGGDFLESFIKRKHGLKDMGGLLPGHGGFLDRVDGLLIAIFAVYLISFFRGWPDISAAKIFFSVL